MSSVGLFPLSNRHPRRQRKQLRWETKLILVQMIDINSAYGSLRFSPILAAIRLRAFVAAAKNLSR